tara:strand:- start:741 stop:1490 length:750 start_codon:yes stop_codon:yes gene_type:complete
MVDISKTIQYDKLRKVKVGQVRKPTSVWSTARRHNKVKDSILENGYDAEKYGYIVIIEEHPGTKQPFIARDGNHRLRVLEELYGKDYEVSVMEVVNPSSELLEEDSLFGTLWGGTSSLPIFLYPGLIFFMWYMFLEVMLVSVVCYLIMMFFKDISKNAYTDTHPKKYLSWVHDNAKTLYELLMFLYYNYRRIIIGIIAVIYVYHILVSHFIGLVVVGVITAALKYTFEWFAIDPMIGLPSLIREIKNRK